MGNRAVVAFESHLNRNNYRESVPSVYLHWNGGPTSVQAALTVANEVVDATNRKVGIVAAFSLVAGMAFNSPGLSTGEVGTVATSDCDNGDNGLYWARWSPEDNGFAIVDREFRNSGNDDGHDADEMLDFVRQACAAFLPTSEEEE